MTPTPTPAPTESDRQFAEWWNSLPCPQLQSGRGNSQSAWHAAVEWAIRRERTRAANELRRRAPLIQAMLGRAYKGMDGPSPETVAGLFIDQADKLAAGLPDAPDAGGET